MGKQKKGNAPPLQIRAGALREAIIAGSVGPNQAQLNACVAALLRGFFTEDQLANFSLSGRKGPTANPDGPVKDKLPVNIRAGIKGMFTIYLYIFILLFTIYLSNRLCDRSVDEMA